MTNWITCERCGRRMRKRKDRKICIKCKEEMEFDKRYSIKSQGG